MGWWWLLIGLVLLAGAGLILGRLAWSVVRSGIAVAAEAGTASARLAELASQVEKLPAAVREQPAVFDDAAALRARRAARLADRARTRRRRRSAARAGRTARSPG